MKRIDVKVYLTLFLLSFFAEIYFVSQSQKDLLSIIGTGVVIFVSMCLSMDSLQHYLETTCTRLVNTVQSGQDIKVPDMAADAVKEQESKVGAKEAQDAGRATSEEFLAENFTRIETVNKAVYVSLKKNIGNVEEKMEKIQRDLQLMEEIHNDSTEETIGLCNRILEENKKLFENQSKIYESLKNLAQAEEE